MKRRSLPRPDKTITHQLWTKYLVNDIVIRKSGNDTAGAAATAAEWGTKPQAAGAQRGNARGKGSGNDLAYINEPLTKQSKIVMKTSRGDFYQDYLEHKVIVTDQSSQHTDS